MRRLPSQVLLVFLFAAVTPAFADPPRDQTLRVYPGEYVIEPADGRSAVFDRGGRRYQTVRRLGAAAQLVAQPNRTAAARTRHAVDFDPNDTFCKDMVAAGLARSCSPNFEIRTAAVPNDPRLGDLWGLSASEGIDAIGAWDSSTGSDDLVVAIIDTGVDYTHPDLSQNIWINSGELPGNGVDDDRNGYIDDVHGMAAIGAEGDPYDENGHGTHVAGTIGARGDNAVGVAGINWRVKLMGCKFLNASGAGSLAGAVEAINYVVMMKARGVNIRITNNSWGGGGFSQTLYNAIKAARDAGILFVAAAGNESNNNDANPSYPAGYDLDNVISVAAISRNQAIASFSNFGAATVDIAAPGVSIMSTFPGAGYRSLSGTSMATPHVAGVLALLAAAAPQLSAAELKSRLLDSGVDVPALAGLVRGGRALNAARMMRGEGVPVDPPDNGSPVCTYRSEEIPFAPDYSADSTPVILQSDELDYKELSLPFSFPFYGQSFGSVILSPNGVLYLYSAPDSMDYKNEAVAPSYSIAALHTDLIAPLDPYGVRAAGDAGHFTVYWLAKYYGQVGLGDVSVRTTLYPDGRIESFVSVPDADLAALLQRSATMGLAGGPGTTPVTFAYNSDRIRDGVSVRYIPDCGDNPDEAPPALAIETIKLEGQTRSGRYVDDAVPGGPLGVYLLGRGAGEAALQLSLEGRACAGAAGVPIVDGYGYVQTVLPRAARRYRTIEFNVGSVHERLRIRRNSTLVRPGRVSRREFDRDCRLLLARLGG